MILSCVAGFTLNGGHHLVLETIIQMLDPFLRNAFFTMLRSAVVFYGMGCFCFRMVVPNPCQEIANRRVGAQPQGATGMMRTFFLEKIVWRNTPPKMNECPLKRDHFKRNFIFQPLIFRGYFRFQAGIFFWCFVLHFQVFGLKRLAIYNG